MRIVRTLLPVAVEVVDEIEQRAERDLPPSPRSHHRRNVPASDPPVECRLADTEPARSHGPRNRVPDPALEIGAHHREIVDGRR